VDLNVDIGVVNPQYVYGSPGHGGEASNGKSPRQNVRFKKPSENGSCGMCGSPVPPSPEPQYNVKINQYYR